jgi:glycerol-3-phosphate acyltransferase PlsY
MVVAILLWTLFGYLVGSIPFAYLVGKALARADIRQVGDGNPGGTNAWKAGGWQIGLLAVALEIFKGFFPVFLARQSGLSGAGLLPVCLAPILGHATQPFLGWRGGKALGASGGVWLALIGWIVFPVYASFTLPVLALQVEHAYAALSGLFALLVFAWLSEDRWLLTFAMLNTLLLFWTHRRELNRPLRWRPWVMHHLLRRQA